MHPLFVQAGEAETVPILFVTAANFAEATTILDAREHVFVRAAGFEPKPGSHLIVPAADGKLAGVLFALENADDPVKDLLRPGALSTLLPAGTYRFANAPHDTRLAALAFALGAYRFARYRKSEARDVRLVVPDGVDGEDLSRIVEGVTLCRDLINTPSNDMGPAELEDAARTLAQQHGAGIAVISGEIAGKELSADPRRRLGSPRAPRLIDLTWGRDDDPKVTLVGKGVCFDTGGLDIKPDSAMLNMKKDMGGAATALALGHMIMSRGLKVRLRVLIPAVENSISGTAFRPRDIYTLAQGPDRRDRQYRRRRPAGARRRAGAGRRGEAGAGRRFRHADRRGARRARARHAALLHRRRGARRRARAHGGGARTIRSGGCRCGGPTRQCSSRRSPISTMSAPAAMPAPSPPRCSCAASSPRQAWLHFDIFAWSPSAKPGRPEGGDCQSARALYAMLCARYG